MSYQNANQAELVAASMGGATPQAIEEHASMGWLSSVLFPELRDTAPPEDSGRSFVPKRVTLDGTFSVDDTGILASTAKIPTSKGMVQFYPYRGIMQSIIRFGFVPSTVSVSWNVYSRLNSAVFHCVGNTTVLTTILSTMVFNQDLAVPYAATAPGGLPLLAVPGDVITVAPNLPENFAYTLTVGAKVALYSDTVPIGDTALNGTTTAAALATTQDVAQSQLGAYTPTSLTQSSVTEKDAILRNSASDGVVFIQGPDVSSSFVPPDSERHDQMSGIWATGDDPNFEATFIGTPGQAPAATMLATGYVAASRLGGVVKDMGLWWISPWAISCTTTNAVNFPIQNITVGAIGEMDNLDIDMLVAPTISQDPAVPNGFNNCIVSVEMVWQHVFATCNSRYEMNITTVPETQLLWSGGTVAINTPSLVPDGPPGYVRACTRPKIYNTDFLGRGKYLGTMGQLRYRIVSADTTAMPGIQGGFSATLPTRIAVRARTSGIQSSSGPVRILQYANMSNGQQVRCTGIANVIAVAQANLAPFVQAAARTSPQALNYNAKLWVQLLFRSNGEIKRVYKRKEYDMLMEKVGSTITTESLGFLLGNDAQTIGAASAAGCFQAGSLFGNLGSAIGQHFGGSMGGVLGRLGGYAIGDLFGASGEFGNYSGPSAAGSFAGGGAMSRVRQRY